MTTSNKPIESRSKRTQALILSAFACPGLGQVVIGRKKRGAVFISASVLILIVIVVKVFIISHQIITPELMMDFSIENLGWAFKAIRSRVYSESMPYLIAFVFVWVASIVDLFSVK